MVKPTLYTQSTCLIDPKLGHLHSKTSPFRDTRLLKIAKFQKSTEWLTLKTWLSKVPCLRKYSPRDPECWSVSLYHQPFSKYKVSKIGKIGMHRMTSKLNSQTSPLYTLNTYHRGPNFGLFRSTISRIEGIAHFRIPHSLPCYMAEKRMKKMPKFQYFTILEQIWTRPFQYMIFG